MNIKADIFGPVFDYMVEQACKDIDSHDGEKRNLLLKAFNRCQEDEHDCADYIYDSYDNEDMVGLLKGGFSMWEIQKVLYDEFPYIRINRNTPKYELESIDGKALENILKNNMREVMELVVEYAPYVDEYMEVYKEYISNRMDPFHDAESKIC